MRVINPPKFIRTPNRALIIFALSCGFGSPCFGQRLFDLEGDGLDDLWQLHYQTGSIAAVDDSDHDGRDNRSESIAGTDPFDAGSQLEAEISEIVAGGQATVRWHGIQGKRYHVELSHDLETWVLHGDTVTGTGAMEEISIPTTDPVRFCRIGVSDFDSDRDGLSDYSEALLGLDPSSMNSTGEVSGGDFAATVDKLTGGEPFPLGGRNVTGSNPSPEAASRFLVMATLGANRDEIQEVEQMGYATWIDDQMTQAPGLIEPQLVALKEAGADLFVDSKRHSWWRQALTSGDILRQRIAFAFSQIWVVSDIPLENAPTGMANYYDLLLSHSFGNARDLLFDISVHPIMGVYLSHRGNAKPDPVAQISPDENYAREFMQLFSIGLFELNEDGTRIKDSEGNDIPTYTNDDITNFARVFTGLSFGGPLNQDGDHRFNIDPRENYVVPMKMFENFHDTDAKTLLRNETLPSFSDDPGRTGIDDIRDAVDNIFGHPNVGPFLAHLLIQRLVTSNPSPDYVRRVARNFADNGQGVRGDFSAVVKAVLLDPEALIPPAADDHTSGRLQEPWVRYVRLLRTFNASSVNNNYNNSEWGTERELEQLWFRAPSVFGYFRPDHRPNGIIDEAGLDAPEFQILNSITAIDTHNFYGRVIVDGAIKNERDDNQLFLDFGSEMALANDPPALLDHLDLLLTYGTLSERTKNIIITAVDSLPESEKEERVHMAVRLLVLSPDFAIFR